MLYDVFWVLSDNLRIYNETKLKGDRVLLPRDANTESLLKSGVLSDVKPKVVYNKPQEVNKPDIEVEPPKKQVKPKTKRRKRNAGKSAERVSELRDTPPPVPEGLPGVEPTD
jgi:hypothetical protein